MDKVLARQPRRMDPPAFEDRHTVLDPQQRLVGADLRQQESCPAAVTRMDGEQFGKGGAGRRRQAPALVQPAGETMKLCRPGVRGDSSASDQRQASCHTTHNVFVLLLFFFPQLTGKSQWCDSARLFLNGDRPSVLVRKPSISRTMRVSAGRHNTAPT